MPALGVVTSDDHRFVVADIPGLIEGASHGAGLGDRFLRHIERTRVLVHLIDAGNAFLEERSVIEEFETIRNEISSYDPNLTERIQWIVLNKVDLVADRTQLNEVQSQLEDLGVQVIRTSGVTREGLDELIKKLSRFLLKRSA